MLKSAFAFLLLFLILSNAFSQWRRIGWEHWPPMWVYQNGDVLYATVTHTVFKSTDDGDTWTDIGEGLPQTFVSEPRIFRIIGDEIHVRDNSYQALPIQYKNGVYAYSERAPNWKFYSESNYWQIYPPSMIKFGNDSVVKIIDGKVCFTSNNGSTWTPRMPGGDTLITTTDFITYYQGRLFANIISSEDSLNWQFDGVYASDDLGLSWQPKQNGLPLKTGIQGFSVTSQLALLCTAKDSTGKLQLYSSQDKGNSWHFVKMPYLSLLSFYSVKEVRGRIFISLQQLTTYNRANNCTYHSGDSGKTWNRVVLIDSSRFVGPIYKRSKGPGYIIFTDSTPSCYWVDESFKVIGIPEMTGTYQSYSVLSYANNSHLYATKYAYFGKPGADTVYESVDVGETWTPRKFKDGFTVHSLPWLKGEKYIYTKGYDTSGHAAIFRSSDEGAFWEECQTSDWFSEIINFGNISDTLLITVNDTSHPVKHISLISYDAGMAWDEIDIPELKGEFIVRYLHSGILFGEYERYNPDHQYYFSRKDGSIWESLSLPFESGSDTTLENIFFSGDLLFLTSSVKRDSSDIHRYTFPLYQSTDLGVHWTRCDSGLKPGCIMSMRVVGDVWYLLTNGAMERTNLDGVSRVYYSTNRGVSWVEVPEDVPMAYDLFVDGKTLYLSSHEGGFYKQEIGISKVSRAIQREEAVLAIQEEGSHIRIEAPNHYGTLSILDLLGRTMYSLPIEEVAYIPLLPNGTYLAVLNSNGKVTSQTFQIAH